MNESAGYAAELKPRRVRRGWTWPKVLCGFVVGLAGAVVWYVSSVQGGLKTGFGIAAPGEIIGLKVGASLMVVGPLLGWIVLPVVTLGRKWLTAPVLLIAAGVLAVLGGALAGSNRDLQPRRDAQD